MKLTLLAWATPLFARIARGESFLYSSSHQQKEHLDNLFQEMDIDIDVAQLEEMLDKNVGSLAPGFRPRVKSDPKPIAGLYDVAYMKYKNELMDKTNKHISVFFPVNYDNETTPAFKFIAYMHGYGGGGERAKRANYIRMLAIKRILKFYHTKC